METERKARGRTAGKAALSLAAALAAFALVSFPAFSVYRDRPVLAAAVAAAALAVALHPRLCALPRWLGRAVMAPSAVRFGWAAFFAGTVFFSALSLVLFEGTPVLDDDASAFFQAKIFLTGRLRVPAPEPAGFFAAFGVISGVHGVDWLCTMYPFGHPLVLAAGLAFGVPWLVMPLFAAGTCVLVAALGRRLFCERTARLAALTCLASPMFAELGATFLNHAATAFGAMLFVLETVVLLEDRSGGRAARRDVVRGLLSGLGLSLAFLCRPADAVVVGVLTGLAAVSRPKVAWARRVPFAAALAVLAGAVALHVGWTHVQTGRWFLPGHLFARPSLRYGFTAYFTPARAAYHATLRTMALGAKATGWPVAAFFPALLPLLRRRGRAKAVWLWSFPAALSVLYFFFMWYEHCFPARYLFVSVPVLAILASEGWRIAADARKASLARLVFAPAAMGVVLFLPFHLASFDDHWYDFERNLPHVVEAAGVRNAVVVCDAVGISPDRADRIKKYFAAAFVRNDPDFRGDVLYVRSLGARDAELPAAFPGRAFWRYRYRRDLNESELYRMSFDPETGEPRFDFIPLKCRGALDPDGSAPSLAAAPAGHGGGRRL